MQALLFTAGLLYRAENSEKQLGREVRYKMLVRALKQETGEELTQLVSESFTVSNYQLHCTCRCTSDFGGTALFTCALQTSSAISGQLEHPHANRCSM